jgi:hypothetical protein
MRIDSLSQFGYSNNQPSGEVTAVIEKYRPLMAPAYWAPIRDFVVQVALDSNAPNEKWALDLLGFVSKFVLWATQSAGLPLERDAIFRVPVVDRFATENVRGSAKTRQLAEARLRRVCDLLGADPTPRRHMVATNDARPYLDSDIPALFSWAARQRAPRTRQDAFALLGFCGGAGLRGRELAEVRGRDVEVTDDRILVHIHGDAPRTIAVRRGWEDAVRRSLDGTESDAHVAVPHVNPKWRLQALSNFGRRAEGHAPRAARLRVTWVMHYLDVLPLGSLLKAAGYKTPASLRRYVDLAKSMDEPRLFALLEDPSKP